MYVYLQGWKGTIICAKLCLVILSNKIPSHQVVWLNVILEDFKNKTVGAVHVFSLVLPVLAFHLVNIYWLSTARKDAELDAVIMSHPEWSVPCSQPVLRDII